jgi:hypothetical protein
MALNFPPTPAVGDVYQGYVWDGEKWLSSGSPTPVLATLKQYIRNGAMMVSQEWGTTAVATGSAVDQFVKIHTNDGAVTIQQAAVPTPGGSPNRLRCTVTTADTAVGAAQYSVIYQPFEGLQVADLMLGTANAKTVTLRFGVRAPAGTYSIVYSNNVTTLRSYVVDYVISAAEANTDVVKTITLPGDVTGTWPKDNGYGAIIYWCLMVGSTYAQAPGVWVTGSTVIGSINQMNFMATVGNVFDLFDVSMVPGTVSPPFVVPDYVSELALCQRYWCNGQITHNGYASTYISKYLYWPVTMRAAPAVTGVNAAIAAGWNATPNFQAMTQNGCEDYHTIATPGVGYLTDNWKASARL